MQIWNWLTQNWTEIVAAVGGIVLAARIFFFKQKTAYEVSRSDWSSDVCSSDLNLFTVYGGVRRANPFYKMVFGCIIYFTTHRMSIVTGKQIGRASCRERV